MPHFETQREIYVAAAPATLHATLNDFHTWHTWSPWEELDPQLERTFSGSATGLGSHYAWVGNKKVGEGSMEITGSTPERIDIDLEFLKPFKASNKTVFELRPEGDGTRVVWSMSGERNLAFAVMGKLFFDKAIAKDFDRGLAKLKASAES
ncbi:SRPBCC family protein [Nocardioides cavernaquae]|uniref:Transcriptional regulator n=1 Tax=Nocardioides cavernaquae TaxID=2321396 RepID=A0A3A5H5N2_9ACTN|nr:SRPBCC family protein [Nocardioides cavernaquae]RJS45996.1 transcriptional regulator [Nocardioides cavernaquae]